MDTDVLEKYAVLIFKVKVIRMRMWLGYVGRVPRCIVLQNLRVREEEKSCRGNKKCENALSLEGPGDTVSHFIALNFLL